MRRRSFLAGVVTTAAGLVLPYEPQRVYSFVSRPTIEEMSDVEYFEKKLFEAIARDFGVPLCDFSVPDFPALAKKLAENRYLVKGVAALKPLFNPLCRDEDFWIPT